MDFPGGAYKTAGSLLRTYENKFLETISILDFGAVGDGITDDTTAINNAITYLGSKGGKILFPIPTVNYKITSTIQITTSGLILEGISNPLTAVTGGAVIGTYANINAFRITANGVQLINLELDGRNTGQHGILVDNGGRSEILWCRIHNYLGDGIRLDTSTGGPGNNNFFFIHKSAIYNNGGKGINIPTIQLDNNALEISYTDVSANTSYGLLYKGQGLRIIGGQFSTNGNYGIQLSESGDAGYTFGCSIYYPWLEGNVNGGIRGGGKSVRNIAYLDQAVQSYTLAVGSEDITVQANNSSGGYLQVALGNGLLTPSILGGLLNNSTLIIRTTNANGISGADIIFQVGNAGATEAMRILNSGLVGINKSVPLTQLQVAGNSGLTSFTGTNFLGLCISGSTGLTDYSGLDFIGDALTKPVARIAVLTTGSGSILYFGTSNNYSNGITNAAMLIDYAANVKIGSSSQFIIDVNGNIVKINNVIVAFPSSQGNLRQTYINDGSGNLTWATPHITSNSGRVTAQTGAVGSVVTYTNGSSDGSFLVSANVLVTTATTHNFTVTVTYTDESNTSRTLTLTFSQLVGTLLTAITNITGAGPYEGIPLHIRCKASTAITVATTGTFTTVTYNVESYISQIG